MAWYNPFTWYSFEPSSSKAASSSEAAKVKAGTTEARKSTSGVAPNAAQSVKDETKAAAESPSRKASAATSQDAKNIAQPETATDSAANTTVDKIKQYRRFKMGSHDSVGDKFKHAFRLDHKEHKAEAAAANAGP